MYHQYFLEMKEFEPEHHFTNEQLKEIVDNLARCIELLEKVEGQMKSGIFNLPFMSDDLSESWLECNKARIHTEKVGYIEEIIQPTMGTIHDAKTMLDSLLGWHLGMTRPAHNAICQCLSTARYSLHMVADEVVSWMTGENE